MSQPLLEIISERRTCRLIRTQEPAIIRANQNHASSGLPSSTEAAPLTGKPKMLSHSETDLEQPSISQRTGSQSAPLTSGFSRMSRLKRKIIKPRVSSVATGGGICVRGHPPSPRLGRTGKSATLCKLDYFRCDAIRFLKETADTFNCVSNHLFRHLRINR